MVDPERITKLLGVANTMPFEYDLHNRIFGIGQDRIALDEFGVGSALHTTQKSTAKPDEDAPLLISGIMGAVYQMPKMYKWLIKQSKSEFEQTQELVTNAMVEAYIEISGDTDVPIIRGDSHWDFGLTLYRPGHPVFRVLGDCACYGVSPQGTLLGESAWEYGYAEYDLHNIDRPAQRTSLYAGAGALARLCRISNEPKLF